jgi:HSP20 family protein
MNIMKRQMNVYDQFRDLRTLQDNINDLFTFDRFPGTEGLFDRSFSPALDMTEGPNGFTVRTELPGLGEKDIDVSIASNVLTIRGEKKESSGKKDAKVYRRETWTGSFQRTLALPAAVDAEHIQAELKDGILTVTLPKREEARPKQISVSVK